MVDLLSGKTFHGSVDEKDSSGWTKAEIKVTFSPKPAKRVTFEAVIQSESYYDSDYGQKINYYKAEGKGEYSITPGTGEGCRLQIVVDNPRGIGMTRWRDDDSAEWKGVLVFNVSVDRKGGKTVLDYDLAASTLQFTDTSTISLRENM